MQVKFPLNNAVLQSVIKKQYVLDIIHIDFIPIGDSAYSYRITDINKNTYYLKLFDHDNDRQMDSLQKLNRVLPVLWELYHQGSLQNTALPLKNDKGEFCTLMESTSIILFHFIYGETLADVYPFSDTLLRQLGKVIATIHQTNVKQSPLLVEKFDLSFVKDLRRCIEMLEEELPYKELKIVLAMKEQINTIVNDLQKFHAPSNMNTFVFCHGDLWGGNLIQRGDTMYVIDWESAQLAPPEFDLFTYIGDGFETLLSSYQEGWNKPINLNIGLLKFYAYRQHLRNLTNWLMNILFRNKDEMQNLNDIEMIQFHCLNRLDSVESNLKKIEHFCSQ
ncbi:MAG TPA: aminoglycoside phosphotransferase family protein [Bacillaceae bacterium]|nr:aminoglycoside phosphotransferase family protein [Bacillaceae bacterium]